MLDEGITQTDISKIFSYPIQWVSDMFAGKRIHNFAEQNGMNTSNVSTKAFSQLKGLCRSSSFERER